MSELVTIASFYTAAEAETLRALLDEAGIPAVVSNAEVAGINFLWTPAIGGVKVQTGSHDAARAKELLTAHGGFRHGMIDADDGTVKCLACGATMADDDAACSKCGWSYEQDAEADEKDEV
jgi:hypothetical protein